MLRLLIKIPTRERKEKFFVVLNKAQKLRTMTETRFLITLDSDDTTMNNDATRNVFGMWGNLKYNYGESISKIDAVNRDMEHSEQWDILLLLSDDMIVQVDGYDKIICDKFLKFFPDTDGALWINDGHTGKLLNTIICIGRKRYERFGYLYHPSYKSLFADNEYTEENKRLGNFIYMEQVLIQHCHPMNMRNVKMDNLYRRNDTFFHADKKTYEERKKLAFA